MEHLENVMAALDRAAFPPPGTLSYDDWIGNKEHPCSYQCHQVIQTDWHYCPRCGKGQRPLLCGHYAAPKEGLSLPDYTEVEPVIVVKDLKSKYSDGTMRWARIECPQCHKHTHWQGRVSHALNRWNMGKLAKGQKLQ